MSKNQIYVEAKVFRGKPRVYIRQQAGHSSKKSCAKSLTFEEWKALKNSFSMIDEELSNLTKTKESESFEVINSNTVRNDAESDNTKCSYPSIVEQNSQFDLKTPTPVPSYNADETQRVVAEILAIMQENELHQRFHLPNV